MIFKKELLQGVHNFDTDVFKIALYTSSATLDSTTTVYSATNEASGTGYTAGGNTLVDLGTNLTSGTAFLSSTGAKTLPNANLETSVSADVAVSMS